MFKTGLLWPSESIQRENEDLLLSNTAQTLLRWTLFSWILLHIVKDHCRYPTEIPLLSFYHSFWFSIKTNCPYALLTLLPFTCLCSGLKTFKPKSAGKLWSLFVKNFEFWFASRTCFFSVWTVTFKRRVAKNVASGQAVLEKPLDKDIWLNNRVEPSKIHIFWLCLKYT